MLLNITPTMRNGWQARAIADVIPALAALPWEDEETIQVNDAVANEIRADCAWYIDPNAVDATVGERAAYRAMLRQIDSALGY